MNPDTEEEEQLTPEHSLRKLEFACAGGTPDEDACCAIAALKAAGWTCEQAATEGELHIHLARTRPRPDNEERLLRSLFLGCVSSEEGATVDLVALRRLGWTAGMVIHRDGAVIELRRPAKQP